MLIQCNTAVSSPVDSTPYTLGSFVSQFLKRPEVTRVFLVDGEMVLTLANPPRWP